MDSIDWDALARYLVGESTPAEAEAMRAWIAKRPERTELATTLEQSMARFAFPALATPADVDVEAALARVKARLDEPDVRALPARPVAPARVAARAPWWRSGALRAAAAVALVAAGTLVWRATRERGTTPEAVARTYTTQVGARDSLRLPDGSRVVLGPSSELVVAASGRAVELRGDAFFDVRHDAAQPFTVRAGGATIRDVGTAFAVHSDEGGAVRVDVTAGSVSLGAAGGAPDRGMILRQGDRGRFEPTGRIAIERGSVTDDDVAWTRGRLVFRDAPLTQVRDELRRWYGIELRLADSSLAGRHLTASFAGDPAERVLDVVALALGGRVERHGDTATVRTAPSTNTAR